MSNRSAGTLGLLATGLFGAALIFFAALTPGYSHATTAISRFGAVGAPHQVPWNVFGFFLPGIFLALHGWGIGRASSDKTAGSLFALAGLAFAATAVPADMSNYSAPTSLVHIAASLAMFAFWLVAAIKLSFGRDPLAQITAASLGLAMAAGAVRFSGLVFPGTGQRLAFAAYFVWVVATSIALIATTPRSSQPVTNGL
jgi:hypothetical membrane protein